MAPQLTAMNGPFARLLLKWIARATSSLPVPLLPLISTVPSVAATLRIVSRRAASRGSVRHLIECVLRWSSPAAVCFHTQAAGLEQPAGFTSSSSNSTGFQHVVHSALAQAAMAYRSIRTQ